MADKDNIVMRQDELLQRIKPILEGHETRVIGPLLGELCARFIACHPPAQRQGVRDRVVHVIDQLVPVIADHLVSAGEVPADWGSKPEKSYRQ